MGGPKGSLNIIIKCDDDEDDDDDDDDRINNIYQFSY